MSEVTETQTVGALTGPLLNDVQVAERLGLSVASVRRWRWVGEGPTFVKIGASVRYRQEDIAEWLESRPRGGVSFKEVA